MKKVGEIRSRKKKRGNGKQQDSCINEDGGEVSLRKTQVVMDGHSMDGQESLEGEGGMREERATDMSKWKGLARPPTTHKETVATDEIARIQQRARTYINV